MKANQAEYPVTVMCEVLGVSRSGYYAWLERPPSKWAQENEALTERIRRIHKTIVKRTERRGSRRSSATRASAWGRIALLDS